MKRDVESISIAPAAFALIAVFVWAGCGPKEPVPGGPHHPASPTAAEAPPAPAPANTRETPPAGGGHDHGGHDHGGHDHGGATEHDPDALIAAEMSAYHEAKPVFDEHCASCHTSSEKPSEARKKALGHFTMDEYPFGGHHAGELGATIRKVLGVDGGEPTMPKDDPGAVEGSALELVVAWTRAYDEAAEAGAGYHGESKGHDHGESKGHDHGESKGHDHGGHDQHGD